MFSKHNFSSCSKIIPNESANALFSRFLLFQNGLKPRKILLHDSQFPEEVLVLKYAAFKYIKFSESWFSNEADSIAHIDQLTHIDIWRGNRKLLYRDNMPTPACFLKFCQSFFSRFLIRCIRCYTKFEKWFHVAVVRRNFLSVAFWTNQLRPDHSQSLFINCNERNVKYLPSHAYSLVISHYRRD